MAQRPPVDAQFEISGTWDFKWQAGSRIRVAFQRLPDSMSQYWEAFADAKNRVIALARRWETSLGGALSFDFALPELDAPLGPEVAPPDRHRSSFSKATIRDCPYDVLVSLEDLPITREDPFRGSAEQTQVLALPIADLGTYARRADYGAPTVYLGRFGQAVTSTDPEGFVNYFSTGLGEHVVVHEFGHVLGLPHLHQHPRLVDTSGVTIASPYPSSARARRELIDAARARFYRPEGDIVELLHRVLGVEVPAEAVLDQLTHGWRGNEAYSDWVGPERKVQEEHTATGALDSVMTFPYYTCMKAGHRECAWCGSSPQAPPFITHPGSLDVEMLRRMYDPGFRLAEPASVTPLGAAAQ